jgi:predicted 3-demethylubiquinone-9 3-methyltransferase (glyoxalase superfamily)
LELSPVGGVEAGRVTRSRAPPGLRRAVKQKTRHSPKQHDGVSAVHHAPGDYPSGKAGDVLTVEFTVAGIPCLGLNGGPAFKHNEAFSFQIATDDQEETDRYWNAIVGNGGQESACGWCRDKWGISWQITPRVLTEAMAAGGDEAKRAFSAMMTMKKIDVAAIEKARWG